MQYVLIFDESYPLIGAPLKGFPTATTPLQLVSFVSDMANHKPTYHNIYLGRIGGIPYSVVGHLRPFIVSRDNNLGVRTLSLGQLE
jgi:hypothetical protein